MKMDYAVRRHINYVVLPPLIKILTGFFGAGPKGQAAETSCFQAFQTYFQVNTLQAASLRRR
jgi:hypothetical protein